MSEPTLYLFDGYNLLHAGDYADERELGDALASFVALRGARGVLVWDGVGVEHEVGSLSIRYAAHADTLLERLAAEHRASERVVLVSSDLTLRGTSGREVQYRSSSAFLGEIETAGHEESRPSRLRDVIDDETRERLERLRRGS